MRVFLGPIDDETRRRWAAWEVLVDGLVNRAPSAHWVGALRQQEPGCGYSLDCDLGIPVVHTFDVLAREERCHLLNELNPFLDRLVWATLLIRWSERAMSDGVIWLLDEGRACLPHYGDGDEWRRWENEAVWNTLEGDAGFLNDDYRRTFEAMWARGLGRDVFDEAVGKACWSAADTMAPYMPLPKLILAVTALLEEEQARLPVASALVCNAQMESTFPAGNPRHPRRF